MPAIVYIGTGSPAEVAPRMAAFRKSLNDMGFVEDRSVRIEYWWAEGRYDRLPALAAEAVRRQFAVIVGGGAPAALAAKAVTSTIPLVFITAGDPVATGLVASLNRPGGNATGTGFIIGALGGKKLELLRTLVPNTTTIAMLVNPVSPTSEAERIDVEAAARAMGQQIRVLNAVSDSDLAAAFATLAQERPGALLVGSDPFFLSRRQQVVASVARLALPALYPLREFTVSGGLMSYGTSISEAYSQAGTYTGRILKGEKPADLPVIQPTKFEHVINLATAKALGLDIPDRLLALADEVIE